MTLGELLSKSSNSEVMFHLTNEGESSAFAIVSAGSSSFLSEDLSSKEVKNYTISNPSKVTVTFAAAEGEGGTEETEEGGL